MALQSRSPTPSIFKKKSSALSTAASYLSAVSEADARSRAHGNTASSTPTLSSASSMSSSTVETILEEAIEEPDSLSYPHVPPTSEQVFDTIHTEFGHCANEQYRYTSQYNPESGYKGFPEQDPPYYVLLTTYLSYLVLIVIGHIRDFTGKRFRPSTYKYLKKQNVRFSCASG